MGFRLPMMFHFGISNFFLCVWQQACSSVLRLCDGEQRKENAKKKFCCLCGCKLKACCFVLRLWGGKLLVCIMPVWQQACSSVLRLCDGEQRKEKAKKKFCCLCGCKLKACCFVLRLWGGKLVVLCYACVAASL